MSSYPRRSARISHLQQDQLHQRTGTHSPTFASSLSQPSSASTSSHPSPIADALHPPPPPPTPQPAHHHLQLPPHLMPQQQQQQVHIHAPLPSPSAGEMEPFFGRPHSQPNPYMSQQMNFSYAGQQRQPQQQQSFGGQQQPQITQQHHLHPHTNSMSQDHPAHVNALNPGQLPPNFLAEAAKRAQMACLMRDLGDVSL